MTALFTNLRYCLLQVEGLVHVLVSSKARNRAAAYILCLFANYTPCLLVVHTKGLWKEVGWVVEGSGVGSAGCGVHFDVHGE